MLTFLLAYLLLGTLIYIIAAYIRWDSVTNAKPASIALGLLLMHIAWPLFLLSLIIPLDPDITKVDSNDNDDPS